MTDIFSDVNDTPESIIFAHAKTYLAGKGLIGLYGTLVEYLGYSPSEALEAVLTPQRKREVVEPLGDIILSHSIDQSLRQQSS